jgi:type II secretory pathway pseudopilin PulG
MNKRGFTLIEIIVLVVLAGIIIPVIVVPFATGVKKSGKPEMAATAMYLAHQKMEEFVKFNYSNAALNPIGLLHMPMQIFLTISGNGRSCLWIIISIPQGQTWDIKEYLFA